MVLAILLTKHPVYITSHWDALSNTYAHPAHIPHPHLRDLIHQPLLLCLRCSCCYVLLTHKRYGQ